MPPAALVPGENRLVLEGGGNPSDDIEAGDLRIIDQPRQAAVNAARLNVVIIDAESGKPLPARVTVVAERRSLMTLGAESSQRLAVRTGRKCPKRSATSETAWWCSIIHAICIPAFARSPPRGTSHSPAKIATV